MKKSVIDSIGPQARIAREDAGMTQMELATKLGSDPAHISRIERSKVIPSVPFLIRLAEACGRQLVITMETIN